MQPKELHDLLFQLLDFATEDIPSVSPKDNHYKFMMAVYIEDFMDVYGRQLIHSSAMDAGLDEEESLKMAHAKLDMLRASLNTILEDRTLHKVIDSAARRIKTNYGTRE